MAVTVPHTIAALPTPPSTASPTNFDANADAFLGALPTLTTDVNQTSADTYANALDAAASVTTAAGHVTTAAGWASNAATSAAAAATSAGAPMWVSGTTYALGAAVWSPANRLIYRRIVAGAGTTDPSSDATNWALLGTLGMTVVVVSGTAQTAVAGTQYVLTNVAATTLTLPASPQSGDTVWITPTNGIYTNAIARNGQTIMGLSEDMTINSSTQTVRLRFINSSWRLV